MSEEFRLFLRTRRSIRHFKPEPVPVEIIQRILETATYAPSAHNLQPWRFVVLSNDEMKSRLAEAITKKFQKDMQSEGAPEEEIQKRVDRTIRRTKEAPVIVLLCRDRLRITSQPDAYQQEKEVRMCQQSVALAGLQLLLAAHAEGLGGTWICWPLYSPDETRQALSLDMNWEPEGMIFLGYPDETPKSPERSPLTEVIRYL